MIELRQFRQFIAVAEELSFRRAADRLHMAQPPLTVTISFELPVPIRVEKLLTTGFGLSRPAVRGMVYSGRIRLPMAIDAKAREDFTFFVITTPPPSRDAAADQEARP